MSDLFGWLFSSTGFMPHGHCYLWQPGTLWLNVGADGLIAAAYYAIPIAIYALVRQWRGEIPYPGLFLMFAAFILLCGTTHLMEIWTVWHPDYRLAGVLKAMTGIVSVATTLTLFRVIPEAMQLRGPRQLQQEVEARTVELAQLNEQLRAQITARTLAEVQLREQDRRKDQFLATLAHELRNPLAPIRQAIKVLGIAAEPEQQRKVRDIIDRQAQRMALLLDDLLEVSRITRGRLALKKERVEVSALVDSALETVSAAVEERGHTLTVNLPAERLEIDVDPLRLSQALSNLLTNATKFTPPGGQITVSVTRTPMALAFTVRDTGIGFEPERAAGLFEMFSHEPARPHAVEGGLGIGLSLVKGLVQLHGGTVEAKSRGTDLGAEFTISIPASLVEPAPNAQLSATKVSSAQVPAPAARVLIVDDNRDAADAMGSLLELAGYAVTIAYGGIQALAMSEEQHPDVVVLDIGMPDMNGYEVARALRQQAGGKRLLLLAVTGWGQAADKDQARAAGFDGHLTKPVAPEVLEAALAEFLRSLGSTPSGPVP